MAATYNDDLFKDSTMTLPEHLEELRGALLKAVFWLVGGSLIGLWFATYVVDFIKNPLEIALKNFYMAQAVEQVQLELAKLQAQGETVPNSLLVAEAVAKDGLVPQLVYIRPQDLAQGPAGLPQGAEPQILFERDFPDAKSFWSKVHSEGQLDRPSPSKRLWTLLPEPAKALAARQAKGEALSEPERLQLLNGLESVLRQPNFYTEQDFTGVPSPALSELLKSHTTLQPPDVARANRWLLADAFPGLVAASNRNSGMIRFYEWKSIDDDPRIRLRALNVQELFFLWMKAGVLFGVVIVSPAIFYHIWEFVAAGLYPHEKKQVHIFLPFSIGLFLSGAGLAYFFVFQYVLDFLLAFNRSMNIDPDIRISEWMNFALLLPVMFGVSFQLPLVMFFLERVGILSVETYQSNWRMSVMVIFVVAMILTPTGDPVTLLLMALPLCGLYFLGIYLCHHWPRQRNPFAAPSEAFDG